MSNNDIDQKLEEKIKELSLVDKLKTLQFLQRTMIPDISPDEEPRILKSEYSPEFESMGLYEEIRIGVASKFKQGSDAEEENNKLLLSLMKFIQPLMTINLTTPMDEPIMTLRIMLTLNVTKEQKASLT